MFVLAFVTILAALTQGQNVELTKQSLSAYSKAICNDGSPAAYYIATEGSTSGDVLIYLEVRDRPWKKIHEWILLGRWILHRPNRLPREMWRARRVPLLLHGVP